MNSKLILGAVAGLVLGLAGGTAFAIAKKPDAPPAVAHAAGDSLAVDSLAAHAAGDDSTAHAAAGEEHHTPVASVASQTPARDSATTAVTQTAANVSPPASQPQPRAATAADSASARLGRIFGAMKPEEAAAVLARLEDAEVRAVLFQLSDRKAAEILARFPGDRAANLTKTLLTDARAR